jgi:hypothetical protein
LFSTVSERCDCDAESRETISLAKFLFMSSRTRLFGVGAAANSSDARRFCLRVQFVDLLLVALLDDAAAEF